MSRGQESAITIACIQMEPIVAEKARNVAKSLEMIEQAAEHGARLVVLPELCNSGYVFNTRAEAFEAAEEVLRDRRTDVYDEMLGTKMAPGWY